MTRGLVICYGKSRRNVVLMLANTACQVYISVMTHPTSEEGCSVD